MTRNGPTEPASDLRQLASFLYQTFVALTLEGFTEQQAFRIIAEIIGNISKSGGQ